MTEQELNDFMDTLYEMYAATGKKLNAGQNYALSAHPPELL